MNIFIIGYKNITDIFKNICLQNNQSKVFVSGDYLKNQAFRNTQEKIEYLIRISKNLQVDFTIVFDKTLIDSGIYDEFTKHKLNIFCTNKKWFNLEKSKLIAKQLAFHYKIDMPKILKYPQKFPVILKCDNLEDKDKFIAYSMKELIDKKEQLLANNIHAKIFIEEFLDGEEFEFLALWDKKTLLHFPIQKKLTEVQRERLEIVQTKLNFMFSDEHADFIGFIVIKLLWAKHDWYFLEFRTCPNSDVIKRDLEHLQKDLVYILHTAIYQKLGEIL